MDKTPLGIKITHEGFGKKTIQLTGFTEQELSELNSMDYREMKSKIAEIADERNNGIGTCWYNGYGIYNAWIGDGCAYIEIGTSCD